MNDPTFVTMPRFVLFRGKDRIRPAITEMNSGTACVAFYAFSDKKFYDAFSVGSSIPLTPYPLVKRFLEEQIAESIDAVHLVIVDADSPTATQLNAVTMTSVLDAQENQASEVQVSYRLTFDPRNDTYLESSELGSTKR